MPTSNPQLSRAWNLTSRWAHRSLLGVVIAAVCLASAVCSTAQTIQPAWSAAETYLELDGDIPLVRRSSGQRTPVPIRPGERIDRFVELSRGWLATGTASADSGSGRRPSAVRASNLLLVAGGDGPTRRLPVPQRTAGRLRGSATSVEDEGELVGLVWLEGNDPRSLAVMAADWTGHSWGPPTVVGAPGPGSQLAPSVSVAEDGTWIAAWSRFDGRDDEIFWSQRRGANWSKPTRAHLRHAGPDIAPVLARHEDTFVLAWTRYEGDQYRAVLSRWSNGRWLAPTRVAPSASAFPSFVRRHDVTYLLYQNLAPSGWTLAELTPSAAIARRATHLEKGTASAVINRRPLVLELATGAPKLSWPAARERADLLWETLP